MPDGFRLGSAFIQVDPDARDFKPKLEEALKKDRAEVKVKVVPDASDFKSKMEADLAKNRNAGIKVKLDPDAASFNAKLDALVRKDDLKHVNIKVDFNKSQLDKALADAGGSGGGLFSRAFSSAVNGGGGGGGLAGGAAGGGGGGASFGGVAIGTGIAAAVIGALAILPTAMAGTGALAGAALGTALIIELNKKNKAFQAVFNDFKTDIKDGLQQAVAPMLAPLERVFKQVPAWLHSVEPMLTEMFALSGKYLMPFVKGMEQLVTNFLPGFNAMLKAAGPAVKTFADSFALIGKYMSDFFKDLIPGIHGSDSAFHGFIVLIGELLDTIGKVASIIAGGAGKTIGQFFITFGGFLRDILVDLAPVINAILNGLLPPLMSLAKAVTPLIGIIGKDLVIAIKAVSPLFGALVQLVKPFLPVLGQLVDVIIKVVVTALSPLIKALVPLAPILGLVVKQVGVALLAAVKAIAPFLGQFGKLIGQLALELLPPLAVMLVKIVPPLTQVALAFLNAMLPAMIQLLPPLSKLITNLQPFINWLTKAIPVVVSFAANLEVKLIKNAIAPFLLILAKVIGKVVDVIAIFVKWAGKVDDWKNLWKRVATDVKNWWDNIERYIVQHIDNIKKDVTNWINDVRNTLSHAWDDIYHDVQSTWAHIANNMHNWWSDFVNFITGKVNTVKSTLSHAWNDIWNDVKHIWGNIEDFFKRAWANIQTGVVNAVAGFSRAWGNIENAFKKPVNFLIQTVYDDGIRSFWNKIVNAVGLKSLDLPNIRTLAHGGIIPGYAPGVDDQPALLSKGEAVLVPGAVRALGHDNINALNAAYRPAGASTAMHGGVLHAAGGFNPIGAAIGAVKSAGSAIVHGAGSAFNTVKDVASIVAALATGNTTALTNSLSKVFGTNAAGDLAKVMIAIPKTLVSDIVKKLSSMSSALGGSPVNYNPSAGVKQWTGAVDQALGMLHLPLTLANQVLYQIQTESGGNPNAINKWDINAQHGDPSRGLLQTIGATFKAFHVPGTSNNIYDPLANIAAAIRYAESRYGPHLMSGGTGLGSGHGYASGTPGAAPGWAWVGEEGPELVQMHGGETVLDTVTSSYIGGVNRGYARGTVKRKPQPLFTPEQRAGNSIISALAASFSGNALPTKSNITSDLTAALRAITTYYKGGRARNLEIQLQKQADGMKNILAKYTSVTATIAAAKAYASSVTGNLTSYADLGNLGAVPTTGTGVGFGKGVQQALSSRLSSLNTFNTLLKSAANKKISTAFLQQAIAMGPDGGTQYLQAILSGGSGLISTINKIETQLSGTETAIGQSAANLLYDPKSLGKGFLVGLTQQQSALDKTMQRLGGTFAKTVAHDLKIPIKDLPHFASGGIAQAGTLAIVGERGPEMVRFNQTGQVYNAKQTAQMMGPQGEVNINFFGPQYPSPEQIANLKLEFTKQMNGYNV